MMRKCGWFRQLNKERRRHWPWRLSFSTSWLWRWKRRPKLRFSLLDDLAFRILYCLEAIVLVSGLCFFYLCCGCHI